MRLQLSIAHMYIHPPLSKFLLFPSALFAVSFQFHQPVNLLRTRIVSYFECASTCACFRVRCLLHVCWTVERLEGEQMWNGQATPGSGQQGSTGCLSLLKKVSWHIRRGASDLDVIVDIFWLLTRHPLLPSPLSNSSQGFLPVAEVGITSPLASRHNLIFLTWVLV